MSDRGSDTSSGTTYDIRESSDGAGRRDDEDDNYNPRTELQTRRPSNAASATGQAPDRHGGGGDRQALLIQDSAQTFERRSRDSVHQLSRVSISRYSGSASQNPNYYNPFLVTPGSAVAGSEQSRSSQPQEFRSSLSALAQSFATIGANDFKHCEIFFNKNPEIFKMDEEDFLREAAAALISCKEAHAKACVQQSILLRRCRVLGWKKRRAYFDKLEKDDNTRFSFLKERDGAMAQIRACIKNLDQPLARTIGLPGGMPALTVKNRHNRHHSDNQTVNPGGDGRLKRYVKSVGASNRATDVAEGDRHWAPARGTLGSGSEGPTSTNLYCPENGTGLLNSSYTVRTSSHKFFTVGRVFSTLWHSAFGSGQKASNTSNRHSKSSVRPGRFSENIISHIQRMAVVKEEHGFCWCVPINSYGGKGVAKLGLEESDIDAHAIIHMETEDPESPEWEPRMSKTPIAVKPASKDQQLDMMSRINFAKVHTVEHNVKVMDVGNISGKSLPHFRTYWINQTKQRLELPRRS